MRFTSNFLKSSLNAVFWRILLATVVIIFVFSVFGGTQIEASDETIENVLAEVQTHPQQQLRGESELPWLFAVYIITWGAFFGYIFLLSRRQRDMRNEIEVLKRVLADRERQEAE